MTCILAIRYSNVWEPFVRVSARLCDLRTFPVSVVKGYSWVRRTPFSRIPRYEYYMQEKFYFNLKSFASPMDRTLLLFNPEPLFHPGLLRLRYMICFLYMQSRVINTQVSFCFKISFWFFTK